MRIVINGVEREASPEEEAAILAQQEIDAVAASSPIENGNAEERETTKSEVATLAKGGDFEGALNKLLELL